jgi:chromosomal replication initiator protein
MAKTVLRDLISDEDKPLTAEAVQKAVCEHFGIKLQDLRSKKRTRELATARQIAMYLCKLLTGLSLAEIGTALGGKDHATVIYACKQMESRREKDDILNRALQNILSKLNGA